LPAGTTLPAGIVLRERVPQGHKVALTDLPAGSAVMRYNVPIGFAARDIARGSWVNERLLEMPAARGLDNLPIATVKPEPLEPLPGHTFEGYRNSDGSVGTRNLLGITTTVRCVAGVVDFAVKRIKDELLPRFPNVDDVVRSSTRMAACRDRCAGHDRAHSHHPQHLVQPQLRRRADGGEPGMRSCNRSGCCRRTRFRSPTIAPFRTSAPMPSRDLTSWSCRTSAMWASCR
jgi:hypothetical protein